MKNKTVKMILAVAVLVLCCGAYVGVKSYVAHQEEQEAKEQEKEDETETVFEAASEDIKKVSFLIDKNEVVFNREGDNWGKMDEEAFPVNRTVLDDAINALTEVESSRVLKEAENLEQYGLDEPSNTIKITTKGSEDKKEKETTLRIGDLNEDSGKYYVSKDEDRNTVYLVDPGVVEPFAKGLYEYAESEDFPVIADTGNIQKIAVNSTEGESYTLEKEQDTGFWYLDSGEKADSAKASSMAAPFGSMAYDKFVDYDCEDFSEYGLDKPYAVIEADYLEEVPEESADEEETSLEDETGAVSDVDVEADFSETTAETDAEKTEESEPEMVEKHLKIAIGKEDESGNRYVSVNDSKEIYTLSSDTLSTYLDKTEADLWDMTVKYEPLTSLEKISVEYKNEKHDVNVSRETLEEEDGETSEKTTYSMDGKEVEETDFTTFYNKLNNMTAERRLTDVFKTDATSEMKVTYTTENGESVAEYYPYDTNYYAVYTDQKTYLVNKMTVKSMYEAWEKILG